MTAADDLVMGIAVGYRPEQIAAFVESLYRDGAFAGELVLFVRPQDRDLIAYLRSWGAQCRPFEAECYPVSHIFMARWFAYAEFFAERVDARRVGYRNVLISDVRDVSFQSPLFARPVPELEFHFEAPWPTIGACPWNSQWVEGCFGRPALERLADERILCAGTVCGRLPGVRRYVALMKKMVGELAEQAAQAGGDQALHNYIYYYGLLPGIQAAENFERVATVKHVPAASLRVDPRARILSPAGSISEIAHQWDRHSHLADPIQQTFAARRADSAKGLRRSRKRVRNAWKRGCLAAWLRRSALGR